MIQHNYVIQSNGSTASTIFYHTVAMEFFFFDEVLLGTVVFAVSVLCLCRFMPMDRGFVVPDRRV